jgi:hypothetical protein
VGRAAQDGSWSARLSFHHRGPPASSGFTSGYRIGKLGIDHGRQSVQRLVGAGDTAATQ